MSKKEKKRKRNEKRKQKKVEKYHRPRLCLILCSAQKPAFLIEL